MPSQATASTAGRLWILALSLAAILLLLFVAAEAWGPPTLLRPESWLDNAGPTVAIASLALLASDVILPVPSSVVMVANGALFGAWTGAVLSMTGSTLSAGVGYFVGHALSDRAQAWLRSDAAYRLDSLLSRFGIVGVVASRPVPIVAEVVAVLAGAGRMRFWPFIAASAAGNALIAVVYAIAGARAVEFTNGWIVLAGTVVVAGVAWLIGQTITLAGPSGDE